MCRSAWPSDAESVIERNPSSIHGDPVPSHSLGRQPAYIDDRAILTGLMVLAADEKHEAPPRIHPGGPSFLTVPRPVLRPTP